MPQARCNGINIEFETFGDPASPPILLIMGLGAQMILWPDEFCEALAAAGHYVIRYDNRDVGLSSRIKGTRKPRVVRTVLASMLRLPVQVPYTLDDMAHDAAALLDHLGLHSAHVVGVSMGGMISQVLAARQPQRVRSLTLIMTTSGNPRLPGPSLELRLRLLRTPPFGDRELMIRYGMDTWRLIGSPEYPLDDVAMRTKVERHHDRSSDRSGFARQLLAIIASGSRVPLLKRIHAPTLVIHGEDDPLVPVAGAHDLAKHIPGARLHLIPGMGHDMPPALLPQLQKLILTHAADAGRMQRAA